MVPYSDSPRLSIDGLTSVNKTSNAYDVNAIIKYFTNSSYHLTVQKKS